MKNVCPICGSKAIEAYVQFMYGHIEYSLFTCTDCESFFYENDFSFDFKENFEHNRNLKTYLEKTSDLEGLINVIHNLLSSFPERTSFGIDIGCGAGIIMDFCKTLMGKQMLGFEPSSHYSKEGKEKLGLDIIQDFYQAGYLENQKVDFAVCMQVLQLEKDPQQLIKEIKRVLAEEGILILSTPDNQRLSKKAISGEIISALSPGVHHYVFSEKSLTLLLKEAGFININIYKRDNQLFALASNGVLNSVDLFSNNREIILKYYSTKLAVLPEDTSYFRGIWYRLFRNYVDHGEYTEPLTLLKNANWFEIWDENDIETINTTNRLFELNTSADAIIYYYIGILLLNHANKYDYAEKFFSLSYLLGLKVIEFQAEMSVVERDILWLAKLHNIISILYKGDKMIARQELILLITQELKIQEWLIKPPDEIVKKAREILEMLET